ncbi:MAG TPA: hypothetical protein VGC72_09110 [Candidatus Elarobacter sp.]|jgi:hypothetical protein
MRRLGIIASAIVALSPIGTAMAHNVHFARVLSATHAMPVNGHHTVASTIALGLRTRS